MRRTRPRNEGAKQKTITLGRVCVAEITKRKEGEYGMERDYDKKKKREILRNME
jgi:hypothetical protein